MTILFFSRLFYPHIGGVERHVLEVGKRLVRKNRKVIVITEAKYHSGSASAKVTGEVEGIKIHRIDVGEDDWFKKFRIWWQLWKLRQFIITSDVIHCHDVFFWYLPFRFIYFNKPVYTTFHGYESYPIRKSAIIIRKISEKLSWGNICIGDYIKKWYGTKPSYVTYGGVELHNYHATVRGSYAKNAKILFIGRLDEQTGIKMYCDAVNLIKNKYPNTELTIAGDGPLRESAEKYGKVLGFITQPEKLFSDYRFAFVSRYLSILEAMAAKRLVFAAYDNPIKRDYLRLSPLSEFIIIASSPRQLAEKVIWIINHPKVERRLIEKGFAFVIKQSWSSLVAKYLALWETDR